MIAKSKTGKGFKGLGKYLEFGNKENPERVEWMSARNLPEGLSMGQSSKLMQATANQNMKCKKPLYHLSISWDKNDNPSRQSMEETADKIIKSLSLENNQILIVSHDDTEHKHIHIMANRINPETLKAVSLSHDYTKIQKVLRELELKNDYRKVHGTLYSLDGKFAQNISSEKEYRKIIKDGGLSFKDLTKEVTTPIFAKSEGWDDLIQNLGEKGLYIQKKGRGIVLTDNKQYIKCSSIDRNFSISNLEKRFGNYEQNIKRKSGRSSPRLHQGEDRRTIERDCRADVKYEQRSIKQRPEDQRTDQERAKKQSDTEFKRGYKDLFDSFVGKFSRGAVGGNDDSKDNNWKEYIGNSDLNVLKAERQSINCDYKNLNRTINTYDWIVIQGEKQELEIKKDFADIYRNPEKAEEKYNKTIDESGLKKANAIMYNNPDYYGRLQGISFLGIKSQKRKEALDKIPFTPEKINALYYTKRNLKNRLPAYNKAKQDLVLNREKENIINQAIIKKRSKDLNQDKSLKQKREKSFKRKKGFDM